MQRRKEIKQSSAEKSQPTYESGDSAARLESNNSWRRACTLSTRGSRCSISLITTHNTSLGGSFAAGSVVQNEFRSGTVSRPFSQRCNYLFRSPRREDTSETSWENFASAQGLLDCTQRLFRFTAVALGCLDGASIAKRIFFISISAL